LATRHESITVEWFNIGSGHELSFVAWLTCLDLLNVFTPEDYRALAVKVFPRYFYTSNTGTIFLKRYLSLCRKLQLVYKLEPAGSHGVWGLDDHQFLPYFWGSSQLMDQTKIKPKTITSAEVVECYEKDYMYLACIHFINMVSLWLT
jgi:serine/threonine-protein phosphatase 2A activator